MTYAILEPEPMNGLIISTDRLINASEARQKFGQLLSVVSAATTNYYVILENGKVRALLVNPKWFQEKVGGIFPELETLRSDWGRHTVLISETLQNLRQKKKKNFPKLLQ